MAYNNHIDNLVKIWVGTHPATSTIKKLENQFDEQSTKINTSIGITDASVRANKVQIDVLNSSLAAAEQYIQTLISQITDISTNISILTDQTAANTSDIAERDLVEAQAIIELNGRINDVQSNLNATNSWLDAINTTTASLGVKSTTTENKVNNLNTSVGTAYQRLYTVSESIDKLNTSVNSLETRYGSHLTDYAERNTTVDNTFTEHQTAIDSLSDRIDALNDVSVGDSYFITDPNHNFDLAISDTSGNILAKFESGAISTKNFNSDAVNTSVGDLYSRLNTTDASLAVITSDVNSLKQSVVGNVSGQIENINSSISNIKQSVKTVSDNINSLSETVSANSSLVSTLNTELESHHTVWDNYKSTVDSKVEKNDASITKLATDVATLQSNVSGNVNNQISAVDTKVESVKTDLASTKSRLNTVSDYVNTNQTVINNINTDLTGIHSQITSINTVDSKQDSSISKLNSSVGELKTKITSVEQFTGSLNTSIYEIKQQFQQFSDDIDDRDLVIATALTDQKNDITNLQSTVSDLTDELATTPDVIDGVNLDFAISDKSGNILTKFANGHIQTQKFDSSVINSSIAKLNSSVSAVETALHNLESTTASEAGMIRLNSSVNSLETTVDDINASIIDVRNSIHTDVWTTDNCDFGIADSQGNIITKFDKGHIYSQKFDSSVINSSVAKLNTSIGQINERFVIVDTSINNNISRLNEHGATLDNINSSISTIFDDIGNINSSINFTIGDSRAESDFDIADSSGNVIMRLSDGGIKTRTFLSDECLASIKTIQNRLNKQIDVTSFIDGLTTLNQKYTIDDFVNANLLYYSKVVNQTIGTVKIPVTFGFTDYNYPFLMIPYYYKDADNNYVYKHKTAILSIDNNRFLSFYTQVIE